jgi:hypothetical protein
MDGWNMGGGREGARRRSGGPRRAEQQARGRARPAAGAPTGRACWRNDLIRNRRLEKRNGGRSKCSQRRPKMSQAVRSLDRAAVATGDPHRANRVPGRQRSDRRGLRRARLGIATRMVVYDPATATCPPAGSFSGRHGGIVNRVDQHLALARSVKTVRRARRRAAPSSWPDRVRDRD